MNVKQDNPNKTLSYDTRGNVIKMDAEAQQQNCLVTKSHNYVKKPGATVWNHTMSVNTCTNQVVSIQSTSDNPNLSPRHDTYTFPAFNAGTSYTVTRPSTIIRNGKRYTIYQDTVETGSPDFSDLGQNLKDGATDGAIGGQMKKAATKVDVKDFDVGKVMEKIDNMLTESGAQTTGSIAGAIIGSEIREPIKPPEEDKRE